MKLAGNHSETAVFWRRAGDYSRHKHVVLEEGDTCARAVAKMCEAAATAAVIVSKDAKVSGILTEQDVMRRLTYRGSENTPVRDVMSRPVHTVSQDDYLYHAIAAMQRFDLRHIPVLANDQVPAGVLHLSDALAAIAPQRVCTISTRWRRRQRWTDNGRPKPYRPTSPAICFSTIFQRRMFSPSCQISTLASTGPC